MILIIWNKKTTFNHKIKGGFQLYFEKFISR